MTDTPIEPALTAEEWKRSEGNPDEVLALVSLLPGVSESKLLAETVALANAALSDDDKRKITREKVKAIRELADEHEAKLRNPHWRMDDDRSYASFIIGWARELAAALESYLKPE